MRAPHGLARGNPITRVMGKLAIKLTLTHEEIAQMIGASRETVTCLFADFRKRGNFSRLKVLHSSCGTRQAWKA